MSQKPSVGRIVHVEFRDDQFKAGIITAVLKSHEQRIDVSVFTGDPAEPVKVYMNVPRAPFGARAEVAWDFPERV